MRNIRSCVYRNKSRRSSLPLFTQPIMEGVQLDLLLFTKSFHSQTAGLLPLNQPIHSFLLCHHLIFDKTKNQMLDQQYAVGGRDTINSSCRPISIVVKEVKSFDSFLLSKLRSSSKEYSLALKRFM